MAGPKSRLLCQPYFEVKLVSLSREGCSDRSAATVVADVELGVAFLQRSWMEHDADRAARAGINRGAAGIA